jgi:hypothetical protein
MNNKSVYSYNEVLFYNKKKWSANACYNMDKSWENYLIKESKHNRHLCKMSRRGKLTLMHLVIEGWGYDIEIVTENVYIPFFW